MKNVLTWIRKGLSYLLFVVGVVLGVRLAFWLFIPLRPKYEISAGASAMDQFLKRLIEPPSNYKFSELLVAMGLVVLFLVLANRLHKPKVPPEGQSAVGDGGNSAAKP